MAVKVFLSYAHEDREYLDQLSAHLGVFEGDDEVILFDDKQLGAGEDWDTRILKELNEADIIILLISADFLKSRYCKAVEMRTAIDRHNEGIGRVVPIVVRACAWARAPIKTFNAMPKIDNQDLVPVKAWDDPDEAWAMCADRIGELVDKIKDEQQAKPDTETDKDSLPSTQPYRGLSAFEPDDADDFFGREALTDELWAKVSTNAVTMVSGGSGSGKSSLINAGIVPRLEAQGDWIIRTRPGAEPIRNLARAITETQIGSATVAQIRRESETLTVELLNRPAVFVDDALAAAEQRSSRVTLIIDQFEETFNLAKAYAPKEHECLIELLVAVANAQQTGTIRALLAMRVDFQLALQEDRPELVEALQNATLMMRRMKDIELEQAITGPAKRRNVEIEPTLVIKLMRAVDEKRDALPLLEVALAELWEKRDSGRIPIDAYDPESGLAGPLIDRAEAALKLPRFNNAKVERLFIELVSIDPESGLENVTRHPRNKDYLDAIDPDLWLLGDQLASQDYRLLVVHDDGQATLDMMHESLFRQWNRLSEWIAEHRDRLLIRQRLARRMAEFEQSGADPDYHLTQRDIDDADDICAKIPSFLGSELSRFVARSREFQEENLARDQVRAIWGPLELSSARYKSVPPADKLALVTLSESKPRTRAIFLSIATSDTTYARKFNRKPELPLRASLGLSPSTALLILDDLPTILNQPLNTERQAAYAKVLLHHAAVNAEPSRATSLIERVLSLAEHTTRPRELQDCAQALRALIPNVNEAHVARASACLIERVLSLAEQTTHPSEQKACAQAVQALAPLVQASVSACLIERVLSLAEQTTESEALEAFARAVQALAPNLVSSASARLIERALSLADQTNHPSKLQSCAQAVQALAPSVEPSRATRLIERALLLASQTTDSDQLEAFAEAVQALAPNVESSAAARLFEHVLSLAEHTTRPRELHDCAQALRALSLNVDEAHVTRALARLIEHVLPLVEQTTVPWALMAFAPAIQVLAPSVEPSRAASLIERVLSLADQATSPSALDAFAQAVQALAPSVEPSRAARLIERVLSLAEHTTRPRELQDCAQALRALIPNVNEAHVARASACLIERVLSLAEQTTNPRALEACASALQALAPNAEASASASLIERALTLAEQTIELEARQEFAQVVQALASSVEASASARSIKLALSLAEQATDLTALQAVAQAVQALAPNVDVRLAVYAIVETLKVPLAGHPPVTVGLLETVASALDRADLLDDIPTVSFWNVMRHLEALQQNDPAWSWLDLGRPPQTGEAMVAGFRELAETISKPA